MMPAICFLFARKRGLHRVNIVERQNDGMLRERRRHARAVGIAKRERAGPGLHEQRIRVAVVAAVELDDFVAPGESAREADGAHARFRARIAHANLLHARHERTNQLRHRDFERIRDAEARAFFSGGFDGGNDFRMGVAENRRPPGADVINQFIAVHVPDVRAFGPVDEERLAADGAERAHGRIDAAGNIFQRLGEQLLGFVTNHLLQFLRKD